MRDDKSVNTEGVRNCILKETDSVRFEKQILADMHTHSKFSHDSECEPEDMYDAHMKKHTELYAVTDHFDTESNLKSDILSKIKASCNAVDELNLKHGNENILKGVEISEGFWYPEEYEKVMALSDYDVVIGSVHIVKYKDITKAYSLVDLSKLCAEDILGFMDMYFDDMLKMIESLDFDILAHLTCPLRYIEGKYKIQVDLTRYGEKIDEILRRIIKKGIALEVNTSSFDMLNNFMPPKKIIKRYRELGGYLITLGSDAHEAKNASAHFKEALEALRETGLENIYYYRKRKPYPIGI